MGYNRELSPAQRRIMGGLEEQLLDLKEGQSATLKDSSTALSQVRSAIYNWLHVNGLKSYFKVRSLSATSLLVLRLEEPKPEVIVENHISSEAETFVKEHLLEVEDEAQAQELLDASGLSNEQKLEAYDEWRRFQG